MYIIASLLILLQLKHWYVDFVNQTMDEVRGKGIYGNRLGIYHSFKQAIGTFVIMYAFSNLQYAIFCAVFDFLIHYHTDYVKVRYGEQDVSNPKFWNHMGLDQMIHQLTYIAIVLIIPFA